MGPAPPASALVPLLVLLAAPPLGGCCSFNFSPVSSTFSAHLEALTPWLILDYPVAMPGNLEVDSRCSDLWGLHFGAVALRRMAGVAGGELAPRIQAVVAHLAFVAECHIHDPQGCVRLEMVNVSQLLGDLAQHLEGLPEPPLSFPDCTRLRCRPGPALSTAPAQPEGALATLETPGPSGTSETPGPLGTPWARLGPPENPRNTEHHGLVLLGGLGGALGLAAAAWALWRRPCMQHSQGTPYSEQDRI